MVSSLLTGSLDHQCTAPFCGLEPRLAEQPHSKYRKALSVILLPFSCLQRMLIFLRSLHLRSPLGLQSLQHLSSPTMGRSIWFTQKLQVTINLLHTSTSASRKATCCQKASVQQRKRQICGKVKESSKALSHTPGTQLFCSLCNNSVISFAEFTANTPKSLCTRAYICVRLGWVFF